MNICCCNNLNPFFSPYMANPFMGFTTFWGGCGCNSFNFGFTTGLVNSLFGWASPFLPPFFGGVSTPLTFTPYTTGFDTFTSTITPSLPKTVSQGFEFTAPNNMFDFSNINFAPNYNFIPSFNVAGLFGGHSSDKVDESSDIDKADGTKKEVTGVDYSIFGSDAERIKLLRPEMQRKTEKLYKYAKEHNLTITLSSGYRTKEEQDELIKTGKAVGYTSRHLRGCAIDIKLNGVSEGQVFDNFGKYAESIGIRWGRHFKNPGREDWHFDIDPKTTSATV